MQEKDLLDDGSVAADALADSALRWLTHADPAEPATAEVAVLMEAFDSLPVVAVRGPEGIGVGELVEDLDGSVEGRPHCWYVADGGPVGVVPAAVVIEVCHGSPEDVPEGGPDGRDAARIVVDPLEPDGLRSDLPALHRRVREALGSADRVTAVMGELLRRGLEEVAVGYPSVRDELEELLWPHG